MERAPSAAQPATLKVATALALGVMLSVGSPAWATGPRADPDAILWTAEVRAAGEDLAWGASSGRPPRQADGLQLGHWGQGTGLVLSSERSLRHGGWAVGSEAHLSLGLPNSMGVELDRLWVAKGGETWSVELGLQERWLGPGRRGSLVLTDNAAPAPALSSHWGDRLGRLGRVHMEAGVGALTAPRTDVVRPGWLWMDARWLPLPVSPGIPVFEAGLSRSSIFGGQGRPTPSLGQLLLPTEPHVYDDPGQVEPDQDELAALDFRLLLPLADWGLPVGWFEAWWQYGGEDVIARDILGIPAPALAGVANLLGAELAAGPWQLTVEGSRILDDYFRWYTGHRVYHDGFTQGGEVMGHPYGGDAQGTWVAITHASPGLIAEISVEQILRVGIVGTLGDNLLALAEDERERRASMRLWWPQAERGRWHGQAGITHWTGKGFVPGVEAWEWDLVLGWEGRL